MSVGFTWELSSDKNMDTLMIDTNNVARLAKILIQTKIHIFSTSGIASEVFEC